MMLYYIHGYESSPLSTKGVLLRQKLGVESIQYRDGEPEDLVISEALQRIKKHIQESDEVTLIGSSLGGFLAAATALDQKNVKSLILLNPAIIPPSVDIDTIDSTVPKHITQAMQRPALFTRQIAARCFLIIGTQDEVVPNEWGIMFAKQQQATVLFVQDDHRLSKTTPKLIELIPSLLQR